ncbi:CsxC family protein [Acetivibrio mesophilus]|uniref:DUF7852 domain-containing protein n=1 Tax=Acetivibrio mesophilus TaxID=2487273 RepID=A0A4Q0I5W6_9FIRM|nr:hypothetical protein [Acetivibrio mesophilus]ODM25226.1 hypothetical protein A7W90_02750 [Clostridium sp. Bc-iso-3]RXE59756.1 hypothetical protein EFD62_05420 [Acetivibrio mesophilus]HHV29323.1 hypothetical protein [Clostridium sp.]
MDKEYTCKAGVIKSETLTECSNEFLTPKGFYGPFVGKIPVVLAEPVIQIDVESVIQLEEPALEIKRIKKNLFINQCKLIDTGFDYESKSKKTGKLFLSGYVRKNIEYATADCVNECKGGISGKIKHTTVKVPFSCVTKVKFDVPPVICQTGPAKEIASFTDNIKGKDFCGQEIIGSDPCEMGFVHSECFNEKVFCELEEVKIFEDDILKDPKGLGCDGKEEFIFDKIIEKMVIFVRLKLLQKQQVNIPGKEISDHKKISTCDE